MIKNKLAFISNPKPCKKLRYNIPKMRLKTNFDIRKNGTSLIVLSAVSGELEVKIPINCEDLSIDELISLLSNIVIEYHKKNEGKTRFFGEVTSYYYQDYKDKFSITFGLDGNVIEIKVLSS